MAGPRGFLRTVIPCSTIHGNPGAVILGVSGGAFFEISDAEHERAVRLLLTFVLALNFLLPDGPPLGYQG